MFPTAWGLARHVPRTPTKRCGIHRLDKRTPNYDDMRPIALVFDALRNQPARQISLLHHVGSPCAAIPFDGPAAPPTEIAHNHPFLRGTHAVHAIWRPVDVFRRGVRAWGGLCGVCSCQDGCVAGDTNLAMPSEPAKPIGEEAASAWPYDPEEADFCWPKTEVMADHMTVM